MLRRLHIKHLKFANLVNSGKGTWTQIQIHQAKNLPYQKQKLLINRRYPDESIKILKSQKPNKYMERNSNPRNKHNKLRKFIIKSRNYQQKENAHIRETHIRSQK